jgi:transposase
MRGAFRDRTLLFSYVSREELVEDKASLRNIRELVRAVLVDMSNDFAALYSDAGRPSDSARTAPSSTLTLQAFYGLQSERQLMEQLDYNLLFRWFVGLSPDRLFLFPPHSPRTGSGCRMAMCSSDSCRPCSLIPRVKPLL